MVRTLRRIAMCLDIIACCCAAALAQHAELAGCQSLWKAEGVLAHSGNDTAYGVVALWWHMTLQLGLERV